MDASHIQIQKCYALGHLNMREAKERGNKMNRFLFKCLLNEAEEQKIYGFFFGDVKYGSGGLFGMMHEEHCDRPLSPV